MTGVMVTAAEQALTVMNVVMKTVEQAILREVGAVMKNAARRVAKVICT